MASSQVAVAPQKRFEDPLAYLPCSRVTEFQRGQVVYHQGQPSTGIHLVIDGKVKVARIAENGHQTVVDVYRADDLFGESALLGIPCRVDEATALEASKVMTWTASEVEDITAVRPKLAIALLQIMVQRTLECERRIEELSADSTSRRLARTLLRFSERLGAAEPDGSWQMRHFTHDLLSQCVGTSREITTHHMNRFRREGYVSYSRKGIIVYREAFQDWLSQKSS